MMINLYKNNKISEDHIYNNKMVGDMQTAKGLQFMSLWYSNLRIQSYAFDLLGSLCFETAFFLVSLENCLSKWLVVIGKNAMLNQKKQEL